jgi:hypothetical protein
MAYPATYEGSNAPPRMRWPLVLMMLAVVVSIVLIALLIWMPATPPAGNIHSP